MNLVSMKLVSVNCATVGPLFAQQAAGLPKIVTGIHKQPVAGSVQVNRLGLAGDEQADPSSHGGLTKAVYAYPVEHYGFWAAQRRTWFKREMSLPFGSLGENLTVTGLLEQQVWVGDRLQIGSCLLEVTEPRQPCFKFNAKMGFAHAVKLMVQSGFTGFYLRVIQTGTLQAGDAIRLIAGRREISIAAINAERSRGHQRDLF